MLLIMTMTSGATSGLELDAALLQPIPTLPAFGDAALEPLFGAPWIEWHNTDGAPQGIEPQTISGIVGSDRPGEILPASSDEYISLGQQLVQVQIDSRHDHRNSHYFSCVLCLTTSGKCASLKINAFEYYRTYPYRTDQWYFKNSVVRE